MSPPILLPAIVGVLSAEGLFLAHARGLDAARVQALRDQVIFHRLRAPVAQRQVVLGRAAVIAMAHHVEKLYNCDMSSLAGWWAWDWCSENAFRDSVDEGTATELRFLNNLTNAVTPASCFGEYVQETVSVGSAA